MTIKQKIKKARYVFVWVLVYTEDGEYIETSKANVLRLLKYLRLPWFIYQLLFISRNPPSSAILLGGIDIWA